MKKAIITGAIALIITGSAFAQPVSDRAVIPLGVTLVQILRIHVTNGGNIEFVFNDIDDFKEGIPNSAGNGFYDTDVEIASSTEWELDMGAEDLTLIGTDDPANSIALGNVGFACNWTGGNTCCAAGSNVDATAASIYYDLHTTAAGAAGTLNGLDDYTGPAGRLLFTSGALFNGGDVTDNSFTINWEAGTSGATGISDFGVFPFAGVGSANTNLSFLEQSFTPDRYVTNVFLELSAI